MTEKCEKYLDRIAKSFDELVKVQKRELKILEDSHRLAVHDYELNLKVRSETQEINERILDQLDATDKEIAEWSQSNQKKST
ncbi:hypothetical protein [uncultured Dubosiella sp.]|uniref:hypothetical protein n=1 Tax=uncultured Dubosiella sp. TaxID=1937011 RepID=UPI00258B1C56|nr:hypothetical protein [uncultured Dubosiella sp.]